MTDIPMRERVARALCQQAAIDDGYDGDAVGLGLSMQQGIWKNHLAQLDAALAVLEEPSAEVVSAAQNVEYLDLRILHTPGEVQAILKSIIRAIREGK